MSKFISSSIWNFVANFIIRIMSLATFPFLVRFYLKEDISVFKSFQAFVLILMAIIPLGTNMLYLSVCKEERDDRWNLFFFTSIAVSLLIAIATLIFPVVTAFFTEGRTTLFVKLVMAAVPIMEGWKIILITKLSSTMEFKTISIALIIKQLFLYACIILFAYFKPVLPVLLTVVLISEVIELLLLHWSCLLKRFSILPERAMASAESRQRKGWLAALNFDDVARKYVTCCGLEQIFITFATQFPTMFVVLVLGRTLAPEFQLPFTAVALPVSLVMNSVARVSFPHFSNLRENELIIRSLFSVLFPITFILFPVMAGIHFFSREISYIFLDASWSYAVFALQLFPLLMIVYMMNMPSTYISTIKGKPQINLVYAICLFLSRMAGIYFGFKLGGFRGTVILFALGDLIVRIVRLRVDMRLLALSVKRYFQCVRFNLYALVMLSVLMWAGYYAIVSLFPSIAEHTAKILSFSAALTIAISFNYNHEKERIREVVSKLSGQLKLKKA